MPSWMQHWGPSCGLPPKHITCQLQASANGWISERSAAEAVLQKKNVQIVSPTCHVCVCARVCFYCASNLVMFMFLPSAQVCLESYLSICYLSIYPLSVHSFMCLHALHVMEMYRRCWGYFPPAPRHSSAACFLLAVVGAVVGIARMQFDPAGLNLSAWKAPLRLSTFRFWSWLTLGTGRIDQKCSGYKPPPTLTTGWFTAIIESL
jgi:hypothetical protein